MMPEQQLEQPSVGPGRVPARYARSHADAGLLPAETSIKALMKLASAYYWEQDADFRFTINEGPERDSAHPAPASLLGKRRWDDGASPVEDTSWEAHQADLRAHRSFKDFLYRKPDPGGAYRYMSSSGHALFDVDGRFRGYAGIARDVTAEHRARHLLQLEHAVSSALAEATDISSGLATVIRAICQSEELESGDCWYLDESARAMRFYQGWGVSDPAIQKFSNDLHDVCFEYGTGLVGWTWRSGEPLWLKDVADDPRVARRAAYQQAGWRCALLFPITVGGQIAGVLDLRSRRMLPAPDERVLRVLQGIGAQIGQFVQRGRAREQLRASEAQYQSTLELAGVGIAHVDARGHYIYANPRLCRMLGYREGELLGKSVKDVSHPDDRNVTDAALPRLRAGELASFEAEKRYLRKDGSAIWVALKLTVKRDEAGRFLHDVSIFEDISSRKRAEAVLRESEGRFRALVNLSSDWYWETDSDFRVTRMEGQRAERGAGGSPRRMTGRYCWDIGLEIEDDGGWERFRTRLEAHQAVRGINVFRVGSDGRTSNFSISGEAMFDDEGRFAGYRGVAQDITERKRAERELLEVSEAAAVAARTKAQFLANMSHEIRTPMNGVLGMLEMVRDSRLEAEQRDSVETAYKSGVNLLRLINDILDLSKIEAGRMTINQEATRFADLVEDVCAVLAEQSGERWVDLAAVLEPSCYALREMDPMRLRQVLFNLVGNALKFTHEGAVVVEAGIRRTESQDWLEVRVIDSGIGISAQAQQTLFEAFSQADGSTTRRYGGTGLGLSITQQLLHLMGGQIGVRSEEGRGSVFHFELPVGDQVPEEALSAVLEPGLQAPALDVRSPAHRRALQAMLTHLELPTDLIPGATGLVITDHDEGNYAAGTRVVRLTADRSRSTRGAQALLKPVRLQPLLEILRSRSAPRVAPVASGPDLPSYAGARVLLVEDNLVNRKVASKMLRTYGVQCDIAEDGEQALHSVANGGYELIFMDCQMPKMDGYEATRYLRDLERERQWPRTPVVALTANAMAGDEHACLQAGMDAYLAKPLERRRLGEQLERWIPHRRADRGSGTAHT